MTIAFILVIVVLNRNFLLVGVLYIAIDLNVQICRGDILLEEVAHESLLQTHFNRALLIDFPEVRKRLVVRKNLIAPLNIFKAAISEDEVLSRCKVVVGPLCDGLHVKQSINNFW